jgi:hypothetical protein
VSKIESSEGDHYNCMCFTAISDGDRRCQLHQKDSNNRLFLDVCMENGTVEGMDEHLAAEWRG